MQATLLCVDDEPNILNALRRLFRPQGYKILTAGSGSEALALLDKEPADLVISDMRMPEMSGAQFLDAVRRRWPQTVRLLLTGYSDIDSTVAAINAAQIARYISKPWNDDEMLLIVRESLERKHLLGEKMRLEALTRAQNEQLKSLNATLEKKVEERTAQLAEALKSVEAARAGLHRGMLNSVRGFSGFLDLRCTALAEHGKRVAERARSTAQRLGLAGAELQNVAIAALVHDIGMLSLSDAALKSPVQGLGSADLAEYLKHCVLGADLLATVEPLRGAAELVRTHHECFDGTGYPNKLRGKDIPRGARILAVADDYDELVSGSRQRQPLNPAAAMNVLREGRGTRYDPVVVDAYLALYDQTAEPAPAPGELILRSMQLLPGMILVRDIVSPNGNLLLASDYALDDELIDGLLKYERSANVQLRVTVRMPTPELAAEAVTE